MAQYWFKPKCCGWGIGWPITWQGWACIGALIGFNLVLVSVCGLLSLRTCPPPVWPITVFVILTILSAVLFCLILDGKVEGGVKWRWKGKA
jgi:hypothetical protein